MSPTLSRPPKDFSERFTFGRRPPLLRPSKDKTREELDKLLHTDDVISMRLLCIEFDSELMFAAACSTWLHSVTRLEYVVDPDLFPY